MLHSTYKRFILFLLFVFVLILTTGCSLSKEKKSAADTAFEEFTNEMFVTEIATNTINLHYTLSVPEEYGIEDYPITFGSYSEDEVEKNITTIEKYYNMLLSYPYEDLSKSNKITYDILSLTLQTELEAKDLYLYSEALGPTIGTQAQLPILLAEYKFDTVQDIDNYISLLCTLDTYYISMIEYEEKKSEAGLFMSDAVADDIIEQCNIFIEDPQSNFLIDVFNEKIDEFKGLTEEESTKYKQDNVKALYNHVIPAYQILINGLTSLKGTGTNDGGLANYKNGKTYYEYLLKSNVGVYDPVKDIKEQLDMQLVTELAQMQEIMNSDSTLITKLTTEDLEELEPDEYIADLKKKMKDDFPTPPDTSFQIKYVHESLQDHLSPAFYLTPQIDEINKNVIYINPSADYDNLSLYTTLAHEGYPGHLYQTIYTNETNPDKVRNLFNYGGYVEGWATYVEMYSFGLADMNEDVLSLLQLNQSLTLCIYSNIDVGVHYDGWTREQNAAYLDQFGFTDPSVADAIYDAILEAPTNYLKYYLGYLNFMDLRHQAEEALGKNFNLKEFHEFVLTIGPSPFPVLEKYLEQFIEEHK